MSTKNYAQLKEDARTNEELLKKLEEADKQACKTGDKAVLIKVAAELGYEITEQDIPDSDDLKKLDDEQLDDVAGGVWWLEEDTEDGHEVSCMGWYYSCVIPRKCSKSESGKHYFVELSRTCFKCKYCGTEAYYQTL